MFLLEGSCDRRDLHVLTHSFLTRRCSDLIQAALLLSLAGVASAQDAAPVAPDAAQAQTLDTVTVTATRIKKAEIQSQVPVQVLTREDIVRSGLTSVAAIVHNLTPPPPAPTTHSPPSRTLPSPPKRPP